MKEKIIYVPLFALAIALNSFPLKAGEAENKADELVLKENKTDFAHSEESFEWRYTPRLGWRKFSRMGAAIKDWKEWERVGAWRY